MYRKSFKDAVGKKGAVGSVVVEYRWGKEFGEPKEVANIFSRGAAGTYLTFTDKSVSMKANSHKIIGGGEQIEKEFN